MELPMRKSIGAISLIALFIAGPTGGFGQSAADPSTPEALSGMLPDGSNYRVVKPAKWNGTLILDLDFANNLKAPPSVLERWMVAHGYAIGGISREPVAYRFPQAVDDLLAVRTMFIERWSSPARTLTFGNSRGGFVSRIAMELRPDVFAGALMSSGGGAGEIAVHNAKLDGLWTLKTLTGVPLKLVGFSNQAEVKEENDRIQMAVKDLRAIPLGRARLALVAAFEQFAPWTVGDEPPAPTDYEAELDQMADSFAFANPAQVRYGVELIAGGNFSWNEGVDYADLLNRSGRKPMVSALYEKAGADLDADLRTLKMTSRISASAAAVAAAEKTTSYSGKIRGPVMVVDNIGDPVDPDPYKLAYQHTVSSAGNGDLLRLAWIRSARHGNQSVAERLAGFTKLIERLDTGHWSDTSPAAMSALAKEIGKASDLDLGPVRFIVHEPLETLRPWDGRDWGTYKGH